MTRFVATFADITVFAIGIRVLACSEIELVANLGFAGTWECGWFFVVELLRVCFHTIWENNGGVESWEFLMVCESSMLASCNFIPECNVIEDEFMVRWNKFGGKFTFNIVSIFKEFLLSMGESETDGFWCSPPSQRPFRCSCDPFLAFGDSKNNFCVSQATHSLFIRENMVEWRKDLVEVNWLSFEDLFPLCWGNSRGGVWSNFDEELSFCDVPVIRSE
jgi:hypothetical protein